MSRYESTNAIVGQFLPKIYTRRITIEDVNNFSPKESETSITIDYQIKDVLDENGIGVITQNSEGGTATQDEILSALKVAIFAFGDAETGQNFARDVLSLSQAQEITTSMDFRTALSVLGLQYIQNGGQVKVKFNDARPAELGFELRNTIYQQYDIDNNVINVIPYSHAFRFDNDTWGDCDNVSILCFTFFDFTSLGLASDGLDDTTARKLGYMVGDLTYDVITQDGKVKSTAIVYKDRQTGTPYYGPVHYHGSSNPGPDNYIGYMAGYGGDDMGPKLREIQVPVTKIQDFRSFQRTKQVNYQPPQLEYFNSKSPNLSFIEKRNKDYFGLEGLVVDYDYEEKNTNIDFTINLKDIYKNNSRYYDMISSISAFWDRENDRNLWPIETLLEILEIKILRRRMTRRPVGTDRLGNSKRVKFMPDTEPDHIVIKSSQAQGGFSVAEREDPDVGYIRQSGRTNRTRSFYVNDMDIQKFDGSEAVFQYGVEIKLLDTTKDYLIGRLERARISLEELKLFAEESKIPVFNSYYVTRPEENVPIGLSEDPSYSEVASELGNYDMKTNTFTNKFKEYARGKYNFNQYVLNFRGLVLLSSGKSSITMVSSGGSLLQTDDTLQSPLSALQSLNALSDLQDGTAASTQSLRNMIDPVNARPETIDSFIKSFQDLVLEMEDFFDVDNLNSISNEGAGYSAKADYGFTVQRWFNSNDFGTDMSTFIVMSPASKRIHFDYGLARPAINLPRTTTPADLSSAVTSEQDTYGIPDDALATITPESLNIGDCGIFFDEDKMEKKKDQDRIEKKRTGISKSKRDRLESKKYIFLRADDFANVAAVNTFVTEMEKMEASGNGPSTQVCIRAASNAPLASFFRTLMSLNDEIVDNSVLYGDNISNAATLVGPTIERDFRDNSNECGLTDNTPKEFNITDLTYDFLREQDILEYGYSQREGRLRGLTPSVTLENIAPQISSNDFPSGGIFDRSIRVLSVDGVPLNVLQAKNIELVDGYKIELASIDRISENALSTELSAMPEMPSPGPMPSTRSATTVPPSYGTFEIDNTDSSRSSTPPPFAERHRNPLGPSSGDLNRNTTTPTFRRASTTTPTFRRASTTTSTPVVSTAPRPTTTTPILRGY